MKKIKHATSKKSITKEPTYRQKKALELMIADGGKSPKGEILREAGYSEAIIKNPHKIFGSDYFRTILHEIVDDRQLISKVNDIALDNEDKRSALQAIDMLLKLKDRYPAGKIKAVDYNEELKDLLE